MSCALFVTSPAIWTCKSKSTFTFVNKLRCWPLERWECGKLYFSYNCRTRYFLFYTVSLNFCGRQFHFFSGTLYSFLIKSKVVETEWYWVPGNYVKYHYVALELLWSSSQLCPFGAVYVHMNVGSLWNTITNHLVESQRHWSEVEVQPRTSFCSLMTTFVQL